MRKDWVIRIGTFSLGVLLAIGAGRGGSDQGLGHLEAGSLIAGADEREVVRGGSILGLEIADVGVGDDHRDVGRLRVVEALLA